MSQLSELARPFKQALIQQAPQGKFGEFVAHSTVNEKLLAVLGPFDFKVVEVIYGEEGRVEGVLASLTCEIDGRTTTIVEVGDCENPSNWKTQGARLKDASSDALKRSAMRLGVGLHLWSQNNFFLYAYLANQEEGGDKEDAQPEQSPLPPAAKPAAVELCRFCGDRKDLTEDSEGFLCRDRHACAEKDPFA